MIHDKLQSDDQCFNGLQFQIAFQLYNEIVYGIMNASSFPYSVLAFEIISYILLHKLLDVLQNNQIESKLRLNLIHPSMRFDFFQT